MENKPVITVRKMNIFHLPQLLRFKAENDYCSPLEKERRVESFSMACLHILRHRDRLTTLGAFNEKNNIVGYATLVSGAGRYSKDNIHLANIAVSEKERGKGVGTILLNTIEEFARERGARRIDLEVFSSNGKAIALYERLGYEKEGVKRRVLKNEDAFDDIVIMAKLRS